MIFMLKSGVLFDWKNARGECKMVGEEGGHHTETMENNHGEWRECRERKKERREEEGREKEKKNYSTQYSRVVPHHSTD